MTPDQRAQYIRKLPLARVAIDEAESRDDLKNALDLVLDLVELVADGTLTIAPAPELRVRTHLQLLRALEGE